MPEGIDGLARLHELVAANTEDPSGVAIGIEIDRGLLVGPLVAVGYVVHAVNPLSVDRYRDRHRTSGAKSDPGDARVLADLVRTPIHPAVGRRLVKRNSGPRGRSLVCGLRYHRRRVVREVNDEMLRPGECQRCWS